MKEHKQDLCAIRHELLKKRRTLGEDECKRAGQAVLRQLLSKPLFNDDNHTCLSVAIYSALAGEIPTSDIFLKLRELGHTLAYPTVQSSGGGLMNFYEVESLSSLQSGAYGILEPHCDPERLVEPCSFDVMLIPLVGFDRNGNRLGMGGGFYDRFLKKLKPQCIKIGIAHDFQEITEIAVREWDVPLDEIITPTRDLQFDRWQTPEN